MPSSKPTPSDCFALLDDSQASAANPCSRLYTRLAEVLECHDALDMSALFERMHMAQRRGMHAVGLFSYELGSELHGISQQKTDEPLAQILLFEHCRKMSRDEVDAWLAERTVHADIRPPAGIANLHANVTARDFAEAIARIHRWIEAGDTYQVNYTYRLRFSAFGDLAALYRKLRARQPVPYGALITLPDGGAVLSLSPELFVRNAQGMLTARPMKGTARASGNDEADASTATQLAADAKSRAENLMIVDLLRNDLGRIAETGSVRVPALFEVSRYGNVLQMTSTIEAQLRPEASLAEVFLAIFPCGSITGAPKHRTMQIIRELEPDARGIYTGAIGWFDAEPLNNWLRGRAAALHGARNPHVFLNTLRLLRAARLASHPARSSLQRLRFRKINHGIGDFCLSVPIRTLRMQPPASDGTRQGEMGVGAGIVHDSVAEREYAECRLKAAFLSGLPQDFTLFETMHATREDGIRHLDLHLARMKASALYFGMAFDEAGMRTILANTCATLPPSAPHRVRLTLGSDGFDATSAPLAPMNEPARLLLSPIPVFSNDLFLRHKTSVRNRYDAAIREAESRGAFDMLFFNEKGELTEGARSNVFVRLAGRWHTPPLAAGMLPGVMRSVVMADPAWNVSERSLTGEDLHEADEIVVTNALRGVVSATIDWQNC